MKKFLIKASIFIFTWIICTLVLYQLKLKPSKQTTFKMFQVCAVDLEDKSLNRKTYNVLLQDITAEPKRYQLCDQEQRFQSNEFFYDTLTLIDNSTNEWEWRQNFDGMGSPLVFRYQIIKDKDNRPKVKPLWMTKGSTNFKYMSVILGFFLGAILLGLVQLIRKRKLNK